MKSTTCQKPTTSIASAALITSCAVAHHRHHHSQYRNSSSVASSSRGNSMKIKPSDANNNDDGSMMTTSTAKTTTAKMTITTTPVRNKNNEKYSLRQRQKRLFAVPSSAAAVPTMSATLKSTTAADESVTSSSYSRSSSASNAKSSTTSATALLNSFKEKTKSKAAPLSKYRRKTANARERTRMREINSAFENLRRCVPHTITGDESTSSNEKLTKITTLRLAMKYIRILSEALENPSFQEDFLLECQNDGDHRFSVRDWTQPISSPVAENSPAVVTTATSVTQSRSKARKTKLQATKGSTKRQRTKTKPQDNLSPYLTSSSTFSPSSSSAYASMSASPLFDDCHSVTDLSSMILESDGESLHLSEPCLSPLNRSYHVGMQSMDSIGGLMKTTPIAISMENPLELSLRLLEPDADSLEFSADQQPSTCISPLATLESLNPFGDLLHTEFPEHSSLDLFLT